MELPEIHTLDNIEWQIFGTLTFKKATMPHQSRLKMWFALTRTLSKDCRVYFPNLLWVLRFEHGERTLRPHFHCLIGGLPAWAVSDGRRFKRENGSWDFNNGTCKALEARWSTMGLHPKDKQKRLSRFSLYDARLNGAAYLIKCLGGDSRLAADAHETRRFFQDSTELTISDSIHAYKAAYLRNHPRKTLA